MKILYIMPLNHALHSPHFRSRFENMPEEYHFHILVTGDASLDGEVFSHVKLHVQSPPNAWTKWNKLKKTVSLAFQAIKLARKEKVDVVISYDPLTLGVVGALAKLFSGAKLVVEVNGHLRNAKSVELAGTKVTWLRRAYFNWLGAMILSFADCVKILNQDQYEEWKSILSKKSVALFHDYVPIDHFPVTGKDDSYILCLGHPFHLKGVDLLFEAFSRIAPEFPQYRLVVMGHCRQSERSHWKAEAERIGNVSLLDPVSYDKVGTYICSSTAMVVPSRSEGMGRVFIEAMAAGKPCVGSRVGGIPNVIVDGVTGFLVEPENPDDLADKLRVLLADRDLRERMGQAGRQRVESVLSGKEYVACFCRMLERELNKGSGRNGIRFNGYEGKNS